MHLVDRVATAGYTGDGVIVVSAAETSIAPRRCLLAREHIASSFCDGLKSRPCSSLGCEDVEHTEYACPSFRLNENRTLLRSASGLYSWHVAIAHEGNEQRGT